MINEIQSIAQKLKSEISITDYHDHYNIDTAMQAVVIEFRENPKIQYCTPESKYKAVLSMVVQGLNPLKGQCSFVPYGNQLQLIRDYSGSIMVAKREDKRIADIRARVVREGDIFEFEIVNGAYVFGKHQPTIKSLNGEIVAAYAVAVTEDSVVIDSDIMTMDDIKKTWKHTNLRHKGEPVVRQDGSIHPGSNHGKYPEKMACKTVLHRLCRIIIKSSNNDQVAATADHDEEYIVSEQVEEVEQITEEKSKVIDFKPESSREPEPPCNKDQSKTICELMKKLAPTANVMANVSEHFRRDIKRLRELTHSEANQYINVLGAQIEAKEDTKKEDELPSWA